MTKVQKSVLLFMHRHGGRSYIETGHKTVRVGLQVQETGEPAVLGNMCLTFGLENQRLAVRCGEPGTPESRRWKLTDKAIDLISRMRSK